MSAHDAPWNESVVTNINLYLVIGINFNLFSNYVMADPWTELKKQNFLPPDR